MDKIKNRDYDKLKELMEKYESKSHLFTSGMFRANKTMAGFIYNYAKV